MLKPVPQKAVDALLDTVKLLGMGCSWGGFESLIIPFDCDPYRTAPHLTAARCPRAAATGFLRTRR
jgi:cystathionine beta-lyase/cystathionine gamma-synthase